MITSTATVIIDALRRSGLDVIQDTISPNLKAQTLHPQHIIYLSGSHFYDDRKRIAEIVERACIGVAVDDVKAVHFRKSGNPHVEMWVFIHFLTPGQP